ncbi:MAG: cupin domain-containing protein [Flavobacteriales bacterium]|nr:cupin domain-containing protein [Flavobacteriales bacterium]
MKRTVFLLLILVVSFVSKAQVYSELKPDSTNYENILVKKIYSDSLSSTFAIWVKKEVKAHKHLQHTEVVTVLEGKGNFTLNDSTFKVKRGDAIVIPKNSVHSVKVRGKKPMLVISVQSPMFDGTDRVWIK